MTLDRRHDIWFSQQYNTPIIFNTKEEYEGFPQLILLEYWAHRFFNDPDLAADFVIDEEIGRVYSSDPIVAEWDRRFWAGEDPFKDYDDDAVLKATKEWHSKDRSKLSGGQRRRLFQSIVDKYKRENAQGAERLDVKTFLPEDVNDEFDGIYTPDDLEEEDGT